MTDYEIIDGWVNDNSSKPIHESMVIMILAKEYLARRSKDVGSDTDIDKQKGGTFYPNEVHIEHPYEDSKPKQTAAFDGNMILHARDKFYSDYNIPANDKPAIEAFVGFLIDLRKEYIR